MLKSVILVQFNDYYNRTIKKLDTVAEYFEYPYLVYQNQNFYPSDGINTSLVLNSPSLINGPIINQGDIEACNYLLVIGEMSQIESRWFIIESTQTRAGQYNFTLRRDVIADNYDAVLDATCYIEKANVPSVSDIAIYNAEDIAFNNIKTTETLLKEDDALPAWIVGYYAADTPETNVTVPDPTIDAIRVSTIAAWEYDRYRTEDYKYAYRRILKVNAFGRDDHKHLTKIVGGGYTLLPSETATYWLTDYNGLAVDYAAYIDTLQKDIYDIFDTAYGYHTINELEALNDKFLYVSTGSDAGYYKIQVVKGVDATSVGTITKNSNTSTSINALLRTYPQAVDSGSLGAANLDYDVEFTNYRINLTRIETDSTTFKIPATSQALKDAPYKMFILPYGRCHAYIEGSIIPEEINSEPLALTTATAIATALGQYLYDVQLLPYCPWREQITGDGYITVPTDTTKRALIKNSSDETVSFILFPPYSTFSLDVTLPYPIQLPNTIADNKVVGQCDKYRLCSPNYSSVFEFNPLKTGDITKFNVDCTYKPFSPYVHINPVWGKLYGRDFDDTRGLILSGDFSLPIINDAWTNYQINNKNYLNAFNRQIESIELQNKAARIEDVTSAILGTVQGGVTGAGAGAMAGGP